MSRRTAWLIAASVAAFNGSLDIRLRFLAIGIEETVLDLDDRRGAAERVTRVLADGGFSAVVLAGDAVLAQACATAASRAGVPVVRVGAGERAGDGADASRAADRLAQAHVALDAASAASLAAEGIGAAEDVRSGDLASVGERVVRALSRVRRLSSC